MSAVRILAYDESDRARVLALFASQDRAELSALWTWKYEQKPTLASHRARIFLAEVDGDLVGILASMPYDAWVEDRLVRIQHATDLLVHADHRQRGIGSKVTGAYIEQTPMSFSWQNPGSRAAARHHTSQLGWEIPWLVQPLDASALVARVTKSRALARAASLVARGFAGFTRHAAPRDDSVSVEQVEQVPADVDDLERRARARIPALLARNRDVLRWRYFERPGMRYTVVSATRAGACCGYAVMRVIDHAGAPWAHLLDYLVDPDDAGALAALVGDVAARARAAGAVALRCIASLPAFRRTLIRCGFMPWPSRRPGWFLVRDDSHDPAHALLRRRSAWHFTHGDGDAELSL